MSELNLILLGPPGAGKGTQAERLQDDFRLLYIATGNILRAAVEEGTDLGRQAKAYMDRGELVPDEVIIGVIIDKVSGEEAQDGFLLDGFPRTITQADGLEHMGIAIDHVVEFMVDDETIVARMSGRRVHPASGRTYHVVFNPPREADRDDVTGEPLIQRDDDSEATVRKRLAIYHEQTRPLVGYYQQKAAQGAVRFASIDGIGNVEAITERLLAALR